MHFEFVRKYIIFARHNIEPNLGEEARESIASAYADLRNKADDRTLPVIKLAFRLMINSHCRGLRSLPDVLNR